MPKNSSVQPFLTGITYVWRPPDDVGSALVRPDGDDLTIVFLHAHAPGGYSGYILVMVT